MPPKLQNRYVTPVYFLGARVICEVRGPVTIVGLSEGLIRWPIGEMNGKAELVVYRGLAKALREEAAGAVAAHFGAPLTTVKKWVARLNRPAPELPQWNDGLPRPRYARRTRDAKARQWTPEEDEIVRTKMMGEAQKLLGVAASTISKRRRQLGVGLHDLLGR